MTKTIQKAALPQGGTVKIQQRGHAFDVIYTITGICWKYKEKAVSEQRARNTFELMVLQ